MTSRHCIHSLVCNPIHCCQYSARRYSLEGDLQRVVHIWVLVLAFFHAPPTQLVMPSYFSSWFPRKDNPDTTSTSQSHSIPTILDTGPIAGPGLTRYNDTVTPTTDYCLAFALGAASGAGALLAWRRWGMRLSTAQWVTPNELARRRWVRDVVTR